MKERPLELFEPYHFNLTIAKDVLEHVPEFALEYLVGQLRRISEKLVIIVPVCNENREYINAGDELDWNHQIRYTLEKWMELLDGAVVDPELCDQIKRDKSKGSLCCLVLCNPPEPG